MSTMAISNGKVANREQKPLKERIQAYFEEHGESFVLAMAAMSGSYYAAAQLANEARD